MNDINELLAQRQALDAQIEAARAEEKRTAIELMRTWVQTYDIKPAEVFSRPRKTTRAPVAPKYRNPATGATWTGRGKTPRWLAVEPDHSLFLI